MCIHVLIKAYVLDCMANGCVLFIRILGFQLLNVYRTKKWKQSEEWPTYFTFVKCCLQILTHWFDCWINQCGCQIWHLKVKWLFKNRLLNASRCNQGKSLPWEDWNSRNSHFHKLYFTWQVFVKVKDWFLLGKFCC